MAKSNFKDRDIDADDYASVAPDISNSPVVTVGTLAKWCGVIFTTVMMVVSCVWFVATVRSDQLLQKQELENTKTKIVEVDKLSQQRHDLQGRDISELSRRNETTEKTVQEMARKLDVALTLLERIDKKVGNP